MVFPHSFRCNIRNCKTVAVEHYTALLVPLCQVLDACGMEHARKPRNQQRDGVTSLERRQMELLLIIGIILLVLALLGFGGVVAALRSAAWLILVIAIVVIVLSFIF